MRTFFVFGVCLAILMLSAQRTSTGPYFATFKRCKPYGCCRFFCTMTLFLGHGAPIYWGRHLPVMEAGDTGCVSAGCGMLCGNDSDRCRLQ